MILKVKYKLFDLPEIVITQDKEVWQRPFKSGKCYYEWRKIEPHIHMGKIHYRINRKRYSKNKLNKIAYLHSEIIETNILNQSIMPF